MARRDLRAAGAPSRLWITARHNLRSVDSDVLILFFAGEPLWSMPLARQTYVGLNDPIREFEALRPYVEQLRRLQQKCRPFGRDYLAIAIAIDALETTAFHFTRRPHFYAGKPHG